MSWLVGDIYVGLVYCAIGGISLRPVLYGGWGGCGIKLVSRLSLLVGWCFGLRG